MAVQFMADAVAGGDTKKLAKMMEQGEVDPIKALPKFFAALKNEATPFMNDFYSSIEARRGKAQKSTEDWMRKFMEGGAGEGIASFFDTWRQLIQDSVPYADKIGKAFQVAAHYMQAALLVPGEVISWLKGDAGEGNFMTALFGSVHDSELGSSIRNLFKTIADTFKQSMSDMALSTDTLIERIKLLGSILAPVVNTISNIISLLNAWDEGGADGVSWQWKANKNQSSARTDILNRMKMMGIDTNNVDVDAMVDAEQRKWLDANPKPSHGSGFAISNPGSWGSEIYRNLFGDKNEDFNAKLFGYVPETPQYVPQNLPESTPSPEATTSGIGRWFGTLNINVDAKVESTTDAEAVTSSLEDALGKYFRGNTMSPMIFQ